MVPAPTTSMLAPMGYDTFRRARTATEVGAAAAATSALRLGGTETQVAAVEATYSASPPSACSPTTAWRAHSPYWWRLHHQHSPQPKTTSGMTRAPSDGPLPSRAGSTTVPTISCPSVIGAL